MSTRVDLPHPVFWISVQKTRPDTNVQLFQKFVKDLNNGPSLDASSLVGGISVGALPFNISNISSFGDVLGESSIRMFLARFLKLTREDFKDNLYRGTLLNLSETEIAKRITKEMNKFRNMSLGNRGRLTVKRLIVHLNSMSVELDVNIRHSHSLGSLASMIKDIKRSIEKLGMDAKRELEAFKRSLADAVGKRTGLESVLGNLQTDLANAERALEAIRAPLKELCKRLNDVRIVPDVCTL